MVVDIPEAYGLFLSRDWSSKLQGYFATDWSQLWLPYKGWNNQIRVESEPYMKHTVTDLDAVNEPISFAQEELGMCFLEALFGCYQPPQSSVGPEVQSELALVTEEQVTSVSHSTGTPPLPITPKEPESDIWTLYYDGSKTHDGAGAGCILLDPHKNKY